MAVPLEILSFLSSCGIVASRVTAHTLYTGSIGSFEFAFCLLLVAHVARLYERKKDLIYYYILYHVKGTRLLPMHCAFGEEAHGP